MRHVAGVPVKIVKDMFPGVETMHGDMVVRDDFEAPGLGVVSAGSPASQIENFQQGFAAHDGFIVWEESNAPVGP